MSRKDRDESPTLPCHPCMYVPMLCVRVCVLMCVLPWSSHVLFIFVVWFRLTESNRRLHLPPPPVFRTTIEGRLIDFGLAAIGLIFFTARLL